MTKGIVSLSVTAPVAPTAVTTETIFSQVVVTAARAGLVTDRTTDESAMNHG
ncbi:MAG TPA: hypothetical protein VMA13_05210 [Candidatus Saccharimonadales bacterium]|nr:hypothetical protein [Candidatus Saccharimonadales bacterium]